MIISITTLMLMCIKFVTVLLCHDHDESFICADKYLICTSASPHPISISINAARRYNVSQLTAQVVAREDRPFGQEIIRRSLMEVIRLGFLERCESDTDSQSADRDPVGSPEGEAGSRRSSRIVFEFN